MFRSSAVRPGASNHGGITPTIRYKSVSIRTLLSRMCGSPPNTRFHSPSLITTSGTNPGELYCGSKVRLSWGCTRKPGKVIRSNSELPHAVWLGGAGQIIFVKPRWRNVFQKFQNAVNLPIRVATFRHRVHRGREDRPECLLVAQRAGMAKAPKAWRQRQY